MKNFYFLIILLFPLLIESQDSFSELDKSQMETSILYDRAVKVANLLDHSSKINATYFRQAISELGQAVYDSNFNAHLDFKSIEDDAFRNNIIPIGILNAKFDIIKTSVIENGLLQIDNNQKLINTSNINNIFESHERTIVSPLIRKHKGLSASFVIDDSFIYSNNNNSIIRIQADFNDNRGFNDINLNEIITVNYQTEGDKKLSFKITFSDNSTSQNDAYIVLKSSTAELNNLLAPGDESEILPINSTLSYQGFGEASAHVGTGEYKIYYDTVDGILDKPILFVDGFDPGDGRTIPTLFTTFSSLGPSGDLAALVRAEGFDLIVLNFPTYTSSSDGSTVIDGGADFIQRNAFTLVELLNTINGMKVGSEQNVVIGPSMGGLVSRYALSYMEQNALSHDTRLYISFDSPHLGANVPIGLQYMFNALANGPVPNAAAQAAISGLLDSPAAKQMLVDHYSAHIQGGSAYLQDPSLTLPAGAPNIRDAFQSELETLGFPQNIRNVSMINGSKDGILTGSPGADVINTTLNIDATNRASVNLKFTPSASQTINVTNLNVETFFIIWIPVFSFTAEATSATYDGVDSAPGGLFDMTSFDDGTDPLITSFVSALTITDFNFIPSVSAMALEYTPPGINWNHIIDIGEGTPASKNTIDSTPFVNWYMPTANEEHVALNQSNVDFALSEIILQPLNTENYDQFSIGLEKNPVKNEAVILTNQKLNNVTITIFNILGNKIIDKNIAETENRISIPIAISNGVYILKLSSGNINYTTRLIVE